MKRCQHDHMGWLETSTQHPTERTRKVWGCLDCERAVGTGKGTIRWRWRLACEEDCGVWGWI